MTTHFAKVPKATLTWEGLDWYNDGFTRTQEHEVVLKRKSKDEVAFGDHLLNYAEAYELYTDLVSATLAKVIQKGNRKHAVQVQTVVQVTLPNPVGSDDIDLPERFVEEAIAWLRFVLGITPYPANQTTWEF